MDRPIFLISDFGTRDPFVGVMKGVILGINPSARMVDLGHEIDVGDIRSASFALGMAFPYVPEDSIILVVVDPGVGTGRRGVAAEIEGRTIVCPDNGLISRVVQDHSVARAVELSRKEYFLPEVSATFHGRDVFAPVAAHLSNGIALEELGEPAENLVMLPLPEVTADGIALRGEIVYIDGFGNVLTNITRARYEEWRSANSDGTVRVNLGTTEIVGISDTFGDAPRGQAVAYFGSAGMLELALNGASMARAHGTSLGAHVAVFRI